MTVTKANEQTLPQAAALACELWPGHTPDGLLAELAALSPAEGAVFLAEAEGAFAGFAQCQLRRDYVEGTETSPVGYRRASMSGRRSGGGGRQGRSWPPARTGRGSGAVRSSPATASWTTQTASPFIWARALPRPIGLSAL